MRGFKLLCSSFLILSSSLVLAQDDGFTNKAEAKNTTVNGLKEGKWIEYIDANGHITNDTNSPNYCLTVYKADKPSGIIRRYYRTGQLEWKVRYTDGKLNGILEWYTDSGKLQSDIPYTEDKINGVEKWYYDNGKLKSETPFTNGVLNGTGKTYYESGKL